ncbi:hypothetical protein Echvi_3694 [Echinicola vietnamensis DSM 17526]|uniref:Uncharacterized protein n=1 Tax=Echinicola vietnamensis (strain DSM 17526 / LMG 23754 / KMM 6221) TaxID=926556 RepID=L0G4G8_ECHVK|nr:hypothetical protein Echvi_3694 [Echinicola vietnamensis DSM 17526]
MRNGLHYSLSFCSKLNKETVSYPILWLNVTVPKSAG